MNILGTVASLYMAILIILLIISFGLIGLKLVNYILTIDHIDTKSKNNINKSEGNKKEVNRWIKAALYSFLGLIVSLLILSILNSTTSFVTSM
jgi:hypothetical protein